MDKKLLILLLFIVVIVIALYTVQKPIQIVPTTATITGTLTLKPCPLDSSKNAYAIQTPDGKTYIIMVDNMYLIEGSPELKPWLSQNLNKTVTLRGEITTVNGQLTIKNPEVI
ncbi:MAG: hypothetical protein QXX79_04685 [Candidatus Bathyarchaeia archaeon]